MPRGHTSGTSEPMSTVIEQTEQEQRWISFAIDVAEGTVKLSPNTLERVARRQNFTSSFRLELAETHMRETFKKMLGALRGPSRRSVIEYFGTAYKQEHR